MLNTFYLMTQALPRRPIVGLALAFVAGTALGLRYDMASGPFLRLAAGLTLVTILTAWFARLNRSRIGTAADFR